MGTVQQRQHAKYVSPIDQACLLERARTNTTNVQRQQDESAVGGLRVKCILPLERRSFRRERLGTPFLGVK